MCFVGPLQLSPWYPYFVCTVSCIHRVKVITQANEEGRLAWDYLGLTFLHMGDYNRLVSKIPRKSFGLLGIHRNITPKWIVHVTCCFSNSLWSLQHSYAHKLSRSYTLSSCLILTKEVHPTLTITQLVTMDILMRFSMGLVVTWAGKCQSSRAEIGLREPLPLVLEGTCSWVPFVKLFCPNTPPWHEGYTSHVPLLRVLLSNVSFYGCPLVLIFAVITRRVTVSDLFANNGSDL